MKFSQYFVRTLKETPSDADTISAKLMLRAGLIRKVASGLYEWLPLGVKTLKKAEQVVREEMNRILGQEVWLPLVQPKEMWKETGRWDFYGKELLRFKDRKNAEFCIAPTAEELITDLARRDIRSYKELPVLLYQFGTKFRDEIRPRFGIMRAREFYMKDGYSFHANDQDLDQTYKIVYDAYTQIFTRLGLKFKPVEADTGTIGGSSSHEFMVLADTGEEQIASCSSCGYAANVERAETLPVQSNGSKKDWAPLEEVATPGKHKVDEVAQFLKVKSDQVIKTVFVYADNKPVVALVRGDTELNEAKLQRLLGANLIRPAKPEEYKQIAQCDVGFAGPTQIKNAQMVADYLVSGIVNGVSGGNKKDVHLKNVNINRDYKPDQVADIRKISAGDPCPKCKSPIQFFKGIEVGHVFKLGTKYSEAMKAHYLDADGKSHPMVMGCYGIGVSRIVAGAIEQNNDEWGIQWPVPLAPFEVVITPTNMSHPESEKTANQIYEELKKKGVDVILDDRDARAGIKFKDADLLGFPFRITIGEKSLSKGKVELKLRTQEKPEEIDVNQIVAEVTQRVLSSRK